MRLVGILGGPLPGRLMTFHKYSRTQVRKAGPSACGSGDFGNLAGRGGVSTLTDSGHVGDKAFSLLLSLPVVGVFERWAPHQLKP